MFIEPLSPAPESPRRSLRVLLAVSVGLSLVGLVIRQLQTTEAGWVLRPLSRGSLPLVTAALFGVLLLIWVGRGQAGDWLERLVGWLGSLPARAGWVWLALAALVYPALTLSGVLGQIDPYLPRVWVFGHLVLLGTLGLLGAGRLSTANALALTLVLFGLLHQVAAYLPELSTLPVSMGASPWSEGSRYYNASLFFARSVYGEPAPLPVLHPSRYLLQSLPFAIPGLPIVAHRIWQVLLWIGMTGLGAYGLARRLRLSSPWLLVLFTAWAYLFLMQGPVYYHLMLCVIPVLWFFDRERPVRSLLVVLLTSAWAGISRLNWLPVPGLLAAALYFLETPQAQRSLWRYYLPPAVYTLLGTLLAFAVQNLYPYLSGNPVDIFGSSATSDLLWYRLMPSATYPLGVIPAITLAAGPLAWVLLRRWISPATAWQVWRWLGLVAILGVLFAGGLVVSAKIGGGSNLHNLDAFLVLFLVVGSYALFDRIPPDFPERRQPYTPSGWVVALLLVIPVVPVLYTGSPYRLPAADVISADLARLQTVLDERQPGGEVLFISNRQLLTFHMVQGVGHVPEYEKVFLMEMAMANHQRYLGDFEQDLRSGRFAMIVTDPVSTHIQDESDEFGEENNAWVERVAIPLMQYYQTKTELIDLQLWVLEPRPAE